MNSITGTTRLTALLGSPVSHSISPLMHNEAFRLLGLDYAYLCFEVTEDTLETAVRGLTACGIRGFNLTMPNKTRILELLDELSPAARMIGACNTVVVENGKLTGHNTDGIGYTRAARDAGCPVEGKTITLMGAGGAATAICCQCALEGADTIHVFARPASRYHARMERLVSEICSTLPCRAILHDHEDTGALRDALDASDLLINATSVGMAPLTDETILPDTSLFRPSLVVSDVIYNPRETRFLREARAAGCSAFNGMYMLLYQGAEAFRLWTGKEMPVEEIRAAFFS